VARMSRKDQKWRNREATAESGTSPAPSWELTAPTFWLTLSDQTARPCTGCRSGCNGVRLQERTSLGSHWRSPSVTLSATSPCSRSRAK
jgi:hypothetical protein